MPEKEIKDFTMGADPEFLCVAGASDVIRANEVVDDPETGSLGADGNGVIFEARPEPSKDPLALVSNIHRIFMVHVFDKPEFADYRWIAGSWAHNNTLGGHIHFGTKDIEPREATNILSQYMGSLSMAVENRQQAQRRRNPGSYGGMLDHRNQSYGFEYRTPSSWLTSPYVAASMLCLAKTVMFERLNNPEFKATNWFNELDFKEVNTEKIVAFFPDIWKQICQMRLYQSYKPHIDLIYFLIKNKLNWFPKSDLKQAWGIMDVTANYPKTQMTLETIWLRYNQTAAQPQS